VSKGEAWKRDRVRWSRGMGKGGGEGGGGSGSAVDLMRPQA
jgi:hypothetical protein